MGPSEITPVPVSRSCHSVVMLLPGNLPDINYDKSQFYFTFVLKCLAFKINKKLSCNSVADRDN